jgi:release factor glutamine methyltransferase
VPIVSYAYYSSKQEEMIIKEALRHGRSQLRHTSPSPELDARLLLQFVLGQSHTYLIAHGERPLTPPQIQQYQSLLKRAQQSEPIPYLIGEAPFTALPFV